MEYFDKLKNRTEWQAYLVTVLTIFLNRFLDFGLTEQDLWALVGAATGYGGSRGLSKMGKGKDQGKAPPAAPAPEVKSDPEPEPEPEPEEKSEEDDNG
jgi:hypothetical protein